MDSDGKALVNSGVPLRDSGIVENRHRVHVSSMCSYTFLLAVYVAEPSGRKAECTVAGVGSPDGVG